MGSAKQELDSLIYTADWRWDKATELHEAIGLLVRQLDYFVEEVIPYNWKGDSSEEAARLIRKMAVTWQQFDAEIRGVGDQVVLANAALDRARRASSYLPSPFVPNSIKAKINAALNDGKTEIVIDGYSYMADRAISIFEGIFGNREEEAARQVLATLQRELVGPENTAEAHAKRIATIGGYDFSLEDFEDAFGAENFADDNSPWQYGGGGGGYNYGGGNYPIPPDYNGPTPPGTGGPYPPGPGGPTPPPHTGGPYPPGLPPGLPNPPYPPYVPGDRDRDISVDDGSSGWYNPGVSAGIMGAAGLGGALAARSALGNSSSVAGAGGGLPGQGGLLGSGGTGTAGPVGAGGAGGAGSSGTGSQMGMMGGQGGRGGAGSDKEKKPSLNGYVAPKLEDDEQEFIPLPDAARAGGRDTQPGGE